MRANERGVEYFIAALLCLGSIVAVDRVGTLVFGVPSLAAAAVAFAVGSVVLFGQAQSARRSPGSPEDLAPTIVQVLTARLKPAGRLCVCVPTYNEAENIRPFVRALLETFDAAGLDGAVLVIDDASPDGTGAIADSLSAEDERVWVLHRTHKAGLGGAYQAAFAWALAHGCELVAQIDCDFSHDPASLPSLVTAAREGGVAIGSRYVDGGAIVGWPRFRRVISHFGSLYARLVLRLPIRDLTGGFKCFRSDVLQAVDYASTKAKGYGFQIELTHRAVAAGFAVREIPITFRDRTAGRSKMSLGIALEAALLVLQLRLGPEVARLRRWLGAHRARIAGGAVVVAGAALTVAFALDVLEFLLALLFVTLTLVGVATLAGMLDAWRDADSLRSTGFAVPAGAPRQSFSLIVPARHEEDVLEATLLQLARQDYPDFEVIVVIGHDDAATRRVALGAIGDDERFRVITDVNETKNKPKALNTALPHCQGEVVGVFDAEDIVAAGLLGVVDATFDSTGADVVQGPTQLVNHRSSWFSARNALEYYFWFKSRLHLQSRVGFIPLGGNSVFVRRSWLLAIGGWDENCLAEDCDLGARLSTRGARIRVAYAAELATREETPPGVWALLRQRTRWSQGFLQVLRKGEWRALPPRARALAVYTLAFPFLQAASCFILPFAIASIIVLNLPMELALLSFAPLVPFIAILAVELVGLHSMRSECGLRVRPLDHLRLIFGAIPYQVLLSIAALRAAWREYRGIRNWEKTAHVGAHL
jgi:cellulose synthase/poly-beta-1,6-N-acetylglucosamine synthase-like glycosyltransferase